MQTKAYGAVNIDHACRSEPADDQNNKRKRFSDEQLSALTDLADEANWSLLSVAKEVREQFCSKYEISKVCSGVTHCAHASQAVFSLAAIPCQLAEKQHSSNALQDAPAAVLQLGCHASAQLLFGPLHFQISSLFCWGLGHTCALRHYALCPTSIGGKVVGTITGAAAQLLQQSQTKGLEEAQAGFVRLL